MVGSLGHTASSRRGLRVLALGVFVAASLLVTIGNAQAAGTHLFPESLIAGDPPFPGTTFTYTNQDCANGNGTFAYSADGKAETPPALLPGGPFAPYPGTFHQTGTVTLTNGAVTGYEANFTISDGTGLLVSGSQTLKASNQNVGICSNGRFALFAAAAYTAQVPDGEDAGCAHVSIENTADGFLHGGQPTSSGAMFELFDPACDAPPPVLGTVTGTVTDQNGAPITAGPSGAAACPGSSVSLGCPGPVATADGSGHYTLTLTPGEWTVVGYAVVNGQLLTSEPVTITLGFGETRTLNFTVIVPTPLAGGGTFVIGTQNSAPGSTVTFWGSQWAKSNGGGSNASSFKGFATTSANGPTCGQAWTSRPGNSSNPPATVPQYMAVVVTSSVNKAGSTLSGGTTKVVLVRTNPGYDSNPGHPGTGTVVAVLCEG
jgi:hypothetical protein